MAVPTVVRGMALPLSRAPNPAVLWGLTAAGLLAAAGAYALALAAEDMPDPGVRAGLLDWMGLTYILAGLIAWWRRPESRFGALMVAVGFAVLVSALQWTPAKLPHTVGQLADLLPAALFLHVVLAFPSGHLRSRLERILVGTAYATALGLQVVILALGGKDRHNVLELVTAPQVARSVEYVELIALAALCLAGIAVLGVRRRAGVRPLRRSVLLLVDAFALGLVMMALLLLSGAFAWPWFETVRRTTMIVIGLAPIAFLAGLLSARLAHTAVSDLLVEMRADPPPADLRDPLARALRDPSLALVYWLPEFGAWVDEDGQPVTLPGPDDGRAVTMIEREGAPVAALVHDRSLRDEPDLLDAVTAAAAIALENGRLNAELRARLEELRGSRARVIDAGRRERQRLERDLHDGAQQRLVALSLELGLLGERLADPEARERVQQAKREVAVSLAELRDVAHGLHPAVLSGHGLRVALESLAASAPVPLELNVALDERLPAAVEVAAYYVACESVTNVGKHAGARTASVDVERLGDRLVVEVVDDGSGGADTERGTGLRGLADRVEALDGLLRVWSPAGGGTRVRAEIPCA